MKKLDKVDKKIIQILQKNARTPLKEIAAQVFPFAINAFEFYFILLCFSSIFLIFLCLVNHFPAVFPNTT